MMTIVKCNNKDSLGRVCNQHKIGDEFCGYPNCNHLATAYLGYKEVKDGEISDEAKEWLKSHKKELYEQVKGY